MEEQYFSCRCTSFEHVVRFTLDADEGIIWVEQRLNHFLPWWKRVLVALLYVLKRPSTYGHFSEAQLGPGDFARLHDLLDRAELHHSMQTAARALQARHERPLLKG